MKTIILIPCYNEGKNIIYVIDRIKAVSPEMDYLIINDGSNDNTKQICIENKLNFLNLPINLGIGGCMQAGYKYALDKGYDIAIQHDGDGQHDPIYFKDVILPIESGDADMTIGSRFINKNGYQSTSARRFGIKFLSALIKLCANVKIYDITSGYRAVNRKFIEIFARKYSQDYPEPEAIMEAALLGAKIAEIPVEMHDRNEGTSSIVSWKPLYYMIKVSFSLLIYRLFYIRDEV